MEVSLGRITAALAEPIENKLDDLVKAINENINPPTNVSTNDVYIRAMYIASNEVNSFGGRFPADELSVLAEMIIDSPVMVGHRKDRLPIGRNFHAEVVDRDGRIWLKSYFYWLKSSQGAESLKENIDGGIYKECSIGFMFNLPECSICGKDIRTCAHQPFEEYTSNGAKEACHFNYRKLERVLETSLVYRGAVPDTTVSKDLKADPPGTTDKRPGPIRITSLIDLDPDHEYLVTPHYEAVDVLISCREGKHSLTEVDGTPINPAVASSLDLSFLVKTDNIRGQLVGYRGKERCSVKHLRKFLQNRKGSVSRVELKLFPGPWSAETNNEKFRATDSVRIIRHKYCRTHDLPEVARKLMTRSGVLVYQVGMLPPEALAYHYLPDRGAAPSDNWILTAIADSNDSRLSIYISDRREDFLLKQFNLSRLLKGGRFVADRIEPDKGKSLMAGERTLRGTVKLCESENDGLRLALEGGLSGTFVVQPIKIQGARRYLFSTSTGSS